MAAPLTQTQLPMEAILDLFGKQTYLGNSFTLPQTGKALTDTSEHPIAVIKNPSGSGKSLFLYGFSIISDLNPTLIRFYISPTINAAGSATAAVNLRSGSTTSSISLCYLGATITANGTLAYTIPCTTSGIPLHFLIVIDQGNSLLITGQQVSGSMGTSNIYLASAWYEI
jgi:hypothetical protein